MPSKRNPLGQKATSQEVKIRDRQFKESVAGYAADLQNGKWIIQSDAGITRQSVPHGSTGLRIGSPVQVTRSGVPMHDFYVEKPVANTISNTAQQLEEEVFLFYPWVGTTSLYVDAIFDQTILLSSLNSASGTAFGDRFLFSPESPFYVSYLSSTGNIVIISVTEEDQSSSVAMQANFPGAAYIGGTNFWDLGRAVSAFEDTSIVPGWRGDSGDSTILETLNSIPVGARCYARQSSSSGSTNVGSTTDLAFNDFLYVFNGNQSTTTNTDCRYSWGFEDYFDQSTAYDSYTEEIEAHLAGQNLSIYSSKPKGTKTTNTDESSTQFEFGFQSFFEFHIVGTNQFTGDGYFEGKKNTIVDSTLIEYRNPFESKTFHMVASDGADYSDPTPIENVTGKNYGVSLVSGSLSGGNITLQIDSGAYTGLPYKTISDLSSVSSPTLTVTLERIEPQNTNSAIGLDAGIAVFASHPRIKAVADGGCGAVETDYPFYDGATHTMYNDFSSDGNPPWNSFRFVVDESGGGTSQQHAYTLNPALSQSDFIATQWILVAQSTQSRYFLSFLNSGINYASLPASHNVPGSAEETATNETTQGKQLTFSIQQTESILWDAVAGDVADMSPGSMVLYAANSMETGHLDPLYSQLLPNNGTFGESLEGGTT